ncbi:MAG: hypothetical protein AUJ92_12575 [Armatimonadetes bacterium CG2_30_59_28]|nr:hypothetical protein [Armatimonadota bacterium]OIO93336.1 MAG: hypothetical protein AUJ92_12575 [Armatimonadetes bacterium CG2_30_59_28]PIU66297.1 MAG: hypothetical protein COS85_05460 [Armatimonadetes bacterium CG07_land_8_20_14_0_80_59_28]PIX40955.1 MAG: hypothetical protein COZ56_13310 [Armatimonadetes bacterium CG_4_8_14_3_um_filter_58_9]PIY44863.1 MAG: hypothetical protein COZ05_07160 [Armatimonadetes bacterium CG_4_10_14_3_um_filter_59_10]PJB71537.1 MAG: hypothetical protein CO095_079
MKIDQKALFVSILAGGRMTAVALFAAFFITPSTGRAEEAAAVASYGIKNIASFKNGGTVISYTSQLDDRYWKASHLIDGVVFEPSDPNTTNGWASKTFTAGADNFPQDVVIGFEGDKPKFVGQVVINPTTPDSAWIGRWAREIEIFASTESPDNPVSYKYVGTCKLVNKAEPQVFSFSAVEAKYLKLRIRSNWGSDRYVSLGEVEVYEAIPSVGELDQLISRLEQLLRDLKRFREETEK